MAIMAETVLDPVCGMEVGPAAWSVTTIAFI
jgi:YHS domain-containing protein